MDELIRVCAVALVGAIAVSLLRKNVPEISVALTAVLVLGMAFFASGAIAGVIKLLYELAGGAGIERELLAPLLRCVGISIVSKIGCDVCRDAGVSAAASYIELIGGAVSVLCAAPLMMALLRQIEM